MLNSDVIQNNVSSLYTVASEVDKLKKEGVRNQEASQKKIDEIASKQVTSVTATDQDSDAQKVLDDEEEKEEKQKKLSEHKNISHEKREIMKDTSKGVVVDITC